MEIVARNRAEKREYEYEDRYKLEISTKDGVEFEMEYEDLLVGENEEGGEVEFEFEAEFDEIIEFVDKDGDGLYDEGEEVYEYDLEEISYVPIQRTTKNVGGVTVHKIAIQTEDGVFKVTIYASGNPIIVHGENVMPSEVKIDIEIDNFPFTRGDSKLALKVELDSELEVEEEKREVEEEDEEEVKVISGNYGGFFSWKNTAMVDGVEKPVLSTDISEDPEEGERELYLIYEQGTSIVHDPKIGVLGFVALAEAMPWLLVILTAIFSAFLSIVATRYIVFRRRIRSSQM
jgi:hypothetical protein